jgi:hypothetical protein
VRSAWLDNLVKAVLVAPLLKQTSEEQLDRGTMHLQSLEVAAGKTALDARITRSGWKLGHPIPDGVHVTLLGPGSLTTSGHSKEAVAGPVQAITNRDIGINENSTLCMNLQDLP